MEKQTNNFIAVAYKLYTVDNGNAEFVEEATDSQPFQFVSGFGFALEDFEKKMNSMEKGEEFDFTLSKEQAYGDIEEERIVELEKETFNVDGQFDHQRVYVGAMLPLQNEEGQRFYGKVLAIADDKVRIDLNHPLAGKELNFKGHVVEKREATNEEIQKMINMLTGEGCGCDCGGCDQEHKGGCGHCK